MQRVPGYYIPVSELQAYTNKAIAEKLTDQQVRDIEIGKAHIGIGMVHRAGSISRAEFRCRTRPGERGLSRHRRIRHAHARRRHRRSPAPSATQRTVREFNGPGNNGSDIRNGVAYNIKAGDVVVIPAGTGLVHEDRRPYRLSDGAIDPDKVTPLKSEAQSKGKVSKPAPREISKNAVMQMQNAKCKNGSPLARRLWSSSSWPSPCRCCWRRALPASAASPTANGVEPVAMAEALATRRSIKSAPPTFAI